MRRLPSELLMLLIVGCAAPYATMAVNVPVTDLRAEPRTSAAAGAHDPMEETQLLYGEQVRVLKTEDGWTQIQAVEQPELTHANRWQGYPGWVPTSALMMPDPFWSPTMVVTEKWASAWEDSYRLRPSSWRFPLGTRLRAVDMGGQVWKVELLDGRTVWVARQAGRSFEELRARSASETRQAIVRAAALFIGDAYYWGGRSPSAARAHAVEVTGVDCSGLVNLAHRAAGIDIPRDAHEQFLRASPVTTLQPADLVFLSERDNPSRIVHVMLYAGGGELIEGPGTGAAVRRIAFANRLGRPESALAPGTMVDGQTVSFGSFIPQ